MNLTKKLWKINPIPIVINMIIISFLNIIRSNGQSFDYPSHSIYGGCNRSFAVNNPISVYLVHNQNDAIRYNCSFSLNVTPGLRTYLAPYTLEMTNMQFIVSEYENVGLYYVFDREPYQTVSIGGNSFRHSPIYLWFLLLDNSLPGTITANISMTHMEHSIDASRCTITSGKFYCGDGQCLDQRFRCDGRVNCFGGKDEEDCPHNQSGQPWLLILLSISTVIMFLIISSALLWFGWTKIMITRTTSTRITRISDHNVVQ
ncbi:uncharacterized protein LOC128391465 [Panonychus citri]|uniref:uncharacterized protein LOC128391465 n=1 Tax=Panonychus citri TaxID=50023 RepID=UPI00230820C6|nr:uncharacterized protein LOC128391465 [Panonychus citri]